MLCLTRETDQLVVNVGQNVGSVLLKVLGATGCCFCLSSDFVLIFAPFPDRRFGNVEFTACRPIANAFGVVDDVRFL